MTPTRPQAVRRQTAPPSCARPGRVRDPSPHEPVSTRTLKKEKRQGRSLPLTRTNVALLAAVDRLFQFGPGGLRFIDVATGCNFVNEISFVHRGSCAGFLVPGWGK